MKQTEITIPDELLTTLNINGMRGRVLSVPHKKRLKRKQSPEILLIYGHHSCLERMYSLAQNVSKYGNVTTPDIPGFGGMDSFYVINKEPTLDNMADYLATFIKMYYKNKKFYIMGMSYGFLIVTKMLQKYPNLTKQVNGVVSIVGFSHKEDFKLNKRFYNNLLYGSKLAKTAPINFVLRNLVFTKTTIKMAYLLNADGHAKLKDADKQEKLRRINFEIYLWKVNDLRTYFFTTDEFLRVNLTKRKVSKPLHHVGVVDDQYFDQQTVNKNLEIIYDNVTVHRAKLPNHAPTVISDEKEAGKLIPTSLKNYLKVLK
jgi:pimeloyl-ACP methyl ester carboxylesterase